jgi:hypothetical protein
MSGTKNEDPSGGLLDLAQLLLRTGADMARDAAPTPVREFAGSVRNLTSRSRNELLDRFTQALDRRLENIDLAEELKKLAESYAIDIHATVRLRPSDEPEASWHLESGGKTVAKGKTSSGTKSRSGSKSRSPSKTSKKATKKKR